MIGIAVDSDGEKGRKAYDRDVLWAFSYENPFAVVDLVLDDFCSPAAEGLEPGLKLLILPLHLDGVEPLCFSCTGEGQTAFLRLIRSGLFYNGGIEHDHVCTLVVKGDDAFAHADHIGRHSHAAIPVGCQGVQKVPGNVQITGVGRLRLLGKKNRVFADFADQAASFLSLSNLSADTLAIILSSRLPQVKTERKMIISEKGLSGRGIM